MQVEVLAIPFDNEHGRGVLHPTVLSSAGEYILVDCGYPETFSLLEAALQGVGLSFRDLTGMLITHHDIDHMGPAAKLKAAYPGLTVYSSAIEAPYISGRKKSLRLLQAEASLASLPHGYLPWAHQFIASLEALEPVVPDRVLVPRQCLLDGVEVVATPGHTPGHISLYLPSAKLLVAADAIVYENGQFDIANPQYTLDMAQAIHSIRHLASLEIDTIICYHGGVQSGDVGKKLGDLISRYAG